MNTLMIERLRTLMREKDITQAELSRLTGIRASSISDWLKGKYTPKQDKIALLADALHVTPAWLLGYGKEEDKKPKVIDLQSELEKLLQQMNADDTTIAMFNGDSPMDEETKELMLASLKNTLQMSKLAQKRKDDHE